MIAKQAHRDADRRELARLALACMDLTSLNDGDTASDIERLCERAVGAPQRGTAAAICVWPRWAALARERLPRTIAVAAVANFPGGDGDVGSVAREVRGIVNSGADEVDLVLPWRRLLEGDEAGVTTLLAVARAAAEGAVLKVILESGELREPALIARAAQLALDAGADFLKTSTGKTRVGATPQAARVMVEAIAAWPARRVGFKPSGGLRTLDDVATYMALVRAQLGTTAVQPARFRLGASSLLGELECELGLEPATLQPDVDY